METWPAGLYFRVSPRHDRRLAPARDLALALVVPACGAVRNPAPAGSRGACGVRDDLPRGGNRRCFAGDHREALFHFRGESLRARDLRGGRAGVPLSLPVRRARATAGAYLARPRRFGSGAAGHQLPGRPGLAPRVLLRLGHPQVGGAVRLHGDRRGEGGDGRLHPGRLRGE